MNIWASLSHNRWWEVSVPPLQYSLVRRSNNKATRVRSLMEMFLGLVPWEAVYKLCMVLTGIGRTLVGL